MIILYLAMHVSLSMVVLNSSDLQGKLWFPNFHTSSNHHMKNVYPLCHDVSFYPLLLSFRLQIAYRKVRNLRVGVDKLLGKVCMWLRFLVLLQFSLAYLITHILKNLQTNKEESFWLANLTTDA